MQREKLVRVRKNQFNGKPKMQTYLKKLEKTLVERGFNDMHIAVISLSGKPGEGRSTIFDFLVKYASQIFSDVKSDEDDWILGEAVTTMDKAELERFADGQAGMISFPEIFVCSRESGDKFCVLLLDSQFSFDDETAIQTSASIFALSTIISSLQIFDVSGRIAEHDLILLEKTSWFARLLQKGKPHVKPFQTLLFLVRDSKLNPAFDHGFEGGQFYLTESVFADVTLKQNDGLARRQNILSCFDEVKCFLLVDPNEESSLCSEIPKDVYGLYKNQIQELARVVLSPQFLILKRVNGELLTAGQLVDLMTSWVNQLKNENVGDMTSVYNTMAEVSHTQANKAAKQLYISTMQERGCIKSSYVDPVTLEIWHEESTEKAITYFNGQRKTGDQKITDRYKNELIFSINKKYDGFKVQNERKYDYRKEIISLSLMSVPVALVCIVVDKYYYSRLSAQIGRIIMIFYYMTTLSVFYLSFLVYKAISKRQARNYVGILIWLLLLGCLVMAPQLLK